MSKQPGSQSEISDCDFSTGGSHRKMEREKNGACWSETEEQTGFVREKCRDLVSHRETHGDSELLAVTPLSIPGFLVV